MKVNKKIEKQVGRIIERVHRFGDRALCEYALKFDRVRLSPEEFLIPPDQLKKSYQELQPEFREAIKSACARISRYHTNELRNIKSFSWTHTENGCRTGQLIKPVDSAGIYVPGGRFAYPSSVLMTAIPARIAGVKQVFIVTPPAHLTREVMAAAYISKVSGIFRVGGPQVIAALAFGTQTIPKVDMIAGPGGAWVTEAKRQLFGRVGIDSIAGPSEVVIVADESAPPKFVLSDLEAQAEHDPNARAVLVTTSAKLISYVKSHISKEKIGQFRLIAVKDLDRASDVVNTVAPEHLMVMLKKPDSFVQTVRHAGAIFVGQYSSAVLGDYIAGPSHVLPTGGSARFSSGLSAMTFLKRSSIINVDRHAFRSLAKGALAIASAEGMSRHARAIKVRT